MLAVMWIRCWASFVACILAIFILVSRGAFFYAAVAIGIVWIEVLVLILNGWRCPLTSVAARYTGDRRANFDIFLNGLRVIPG